MSDTSGNNIRLECPFCKKDFLTKSFSSHLEYEHQEEIFKNKHNKDELEDFTKITSTFHFRPLEIKIKDKDYYYVPCCKKYYSKIGTAQKQHSTNKECCAKVKDQAKELLNKLVPSVVNIHSGSGNNITNITQNITIVDLSGNIISTFRNVITAMDIKEEERALEHKKNMKYKKLLEENGIEYDSDVSSILSYYGNDEHDDERVYRYDIEKRVDKRVIKRFRDLGVDLSREGLNIRTEQTQKEEKQQKQEADKEEREEIERDISELEESIDGYNDIIQDREDRIKHLKDSTPENEWKLITEDISKFTNKINECKRNIKENKEELKTLRNRLSKVR